tara:strand:+ start:633 stop:1454 length:822 start_codon:yes stop_codon:yes gene_type:complete
MLGCLLCFFKVSADQASDSLKYKVIYKLSYQPDSTNVASQKSEITWLFLGDNSSIFLSKPLAMKDSLPKLSIADFSSERMKEYKAKTKTHFDFKVFKSGEEQQLYYTTKILDDKLFYTEPLGTPNWEIHPESKEIFGYQVQKATTSFAGRNYVAWFTPEIPIPDGPYKFNGLPGLILSIEDTQQHYAFSFVGFQKLTEPVAFAITTEDSQKSTKKQLLDLKKRYDKDPISYINNYVGSGGKKVTVTLTNQDKKDYLKARKAKLAKNNNPIELE